MSVTDSIWIQTTPATNYPVLDRNLSVDVVVAGGGLTGLHTAITLLESGLTVAVVEGNRVGLGTSGRTVGKLVSGHAYLYGSIQKNFGDEAVRLYAESNVGGFNRVHELCARYDIACDLAPMDSYIVTSKEAGIPQLKNEYEAMKAAGLSVEWLDSLSKPFVDSGLSDSSEFSEPFETVGAIRQPDQARYHPRKFLLGLAGAITDLGGLIFERTAAVEVSGADSKPGTASQAVAAGGTQTDTTTCHVTTNTGFVVHANKVIICTRVGLSPDEPFLDNLSPWRGHTNAYNTATPQLDSAYFRLTGAVDSLRPHEDELTKTYYTVASGNDEDALEFEDARHVAAIDQWAQEHFEVNAAYAQWWCEDMISDDDLPLIGTYRKDSTNIFMAAGFCGWGMTKSAMAGMMLADLAQGKPSPYAELYSPGRF